MTDKGGDSNTGRDDAGIGYTFYCFLLFFLYSPLDILFIALLLL